MLPETCATRYCTRKVRPGHRYCDECFAVVWRTGSEPALPVPMPRWRQWTMEHGAGKDLSNAA